MKNAHNEVL
jgi:hypothetical protein